MAWVRLGQIFAPDGSKSWARSHAALPAPLHLHDDIFRIYFSARDADRRSHVGWVDVEISDTPRVIAIAQDPVLLPGANGSFDDSGASIGCLVRVDGLLRMYYLGWNLGLRASWRNAIGMAEAATPDGPFVRYSPGPILDRSPEDPYSLSYPFVSRTKSGGWRMWYGSSLTPARGNSEMNYAIKHASSDDGIRWVRDGVTIVGSTSPDEFILARPTIVETGRSSLMALMSRGERYRIGAATSQDGYHWTRIDGAMGLTPSPEGWDSDICYPNLFWHRDRLWMLYCGNGYGIAGFGLAVWSGQIA